MPIAPAVHAWLLTISNFSAVTRVNPLNLCRLKRLSVDLMVELALADSHDRIMPTG
jgi:hypothetical protein